MGGGTTSCSMQDGTAIKTDKNNIVKTKTLIGKILVKYKILRTNTQKDAPKEKKQYKTWKIVIPSKSQSYLVLAYL
jgi:hypothetical protein